MIFQTIQGASVPALGLGTWQLKGDACRHGVAEAIEIGYRHVDTAQGYSNETEVGEGLRDSGVDRADIFLTTKIWIGDLTPEGVAPTVEESLKRLRMEYVDLLLIHWPSQEVSIPRILGAMDALREAGKTRHIGVSNFPPSLFERALAHAPVFCNQVEYHPFLGQETLLDLCRTHDVMLTAYSPLALGRVMQDPALRRIGEAHGKTPAQVTLRWLIQQENVSAIPKAARREHRVGNFDIFDFELSPQEMDGIYGLERGDRLTDPEWAPDWE